MVKHTVMFQLYGGPEERRRVALELREALMALPAVIEPLVSIEVGINENPAEQWDLVLTALLPDMESVPVYAKHPAHVDVVTRLLSKYQKTRACVDYYCD